MSAPEAMQGEKIKKAFRAINEFEDKLTPVQQEVIWDLWDYAARIEETLQLIRKSTSDLDTQTICEQALEYDYGVFVEASPDPRQLDLFNGA